MRYEQDLKDLKNMFIKAWEQITDEDIKERVRQKITFVKEYIENSTNAYNDNQCGLNKVNEETVDMHMNHIREYLVSIGVKI